MFGKAISNLMIKPGLAPVFDSPENHGLNYEDVTFKLEDGVTLSGWLIKGAPTRSLSNLTSGCNAPGVDSPSKGKVPWSACSGTPTSIS